VTKKKWLIIGNIVVLVLFVMSVLMSASNVTKLDTSGFGSLCEAVDNCDLTWTTGGDANWFVQVDGSCYCCYFYDGDGAQSGKVSASQSSYIRTTVTGPGQFSFHWKISFGYVDKLNFYMDNVLQGYIMGMGGGDWSQRVCAIPVGTHTLEWVYNRSIYGSDSTCAWLDKVEFTRDTAIVLNRKQLTFGAIQGISTEPQTFYIKGSVPGPLYWTASWEQGWLKVTPGAHIGNNVVTVSVNPAGLSVGTYHAPLTIFANGATNNPQTVSVTLHVYKPGKSKLPFGTFETPTNNSTIRSSVPFTGWVLDDVGVQSVKIYRQGGGSLIYIGDGVLVEGPRPDVEQAYPHYPFNYKAGWGYMMLTNFLPNKGNGTFTITAIATDMEGHQVKLGSKTVTLDNVNAVKPFGAIDTPAQGGTASGANYVNWGWVLTPQPNSIPIDGSTINVWVDGVNLGNPGYNNYRSDIAALFPGYANSNGAVGYFNIDTTAYSSGIHTIQWTATDSAGNTDGIGSRYFAIENSDILQFSGQSAQHTGYSIVPPVSYPGFITPAQDLVADTSTPIGIVKGYQINVTAADPELIYPDGQGMIMVKTKETERIELHLGITGKISGWLEAGHQFRPLPPGSYLDRENGILYWQIGLAYIGKYKLVFISEDEYGIQTARKVLINIMPKY
jgi:hypothetical protein